MPLLTTTQPRPRHHRRRILAGLAGVIAVAAWAAGPADAAPAPSRISGDHHSPTVVQLANGALAAHDAFSTTGTPGAFVAYVAARNATADAVAVEMGLDPAALREAWARGDQRHQEALLAALSQLGATYRHASSDPAVGFDCSGLTSYAWRRAGIDLPRQSGSQISVAARRDASTAVAGDILQYPGHVMIWLGIGQAIVHASNPATDVELSFVNRSIRYGDPEA